MLVGIFYGIFQLAILVNNVQIMRILITDMSGGLVLKCAWCEFTVQLTTDMCTNNELASKNLNEHVLEYRCEFVKGKCC